MTINNRRDRIYSRPHTGEIGLFAESDTSTIGGSASRDRGVTLLEFRDVFAVYKALKPLSINATPLRHLYFARESALAVLPTHVTVNFVRTR